ncbi:hypothetical protein NBM05_08425 [Rothia sp. AR01]|uniref:Uncharacterized protein n=1 Tax=Rothia santali TaxID=2949643 RepID=A0A9X2KLD5_9MICC|nr:hypothetical protein [Rothia santali]MCP3426026.1 hypothetical protein [Rothia santali]
MSVTADEARERLHRALRGIDGRLPVYTGTVDRAVPTHPSGRIRPYVCLWVSQGAADPAMEALDALAATGARRLRIHTQLVGADAANVHWLADRVGPALTNLRVGDHVVKPDAEQHAHAFIITDTGVTPPRQYLPLLWTLDLD